MNITVLHEQAAYAKSVSEAAAKVEAELRRQIEDATELGEDDEPVSAVTDDGTSILVRAVAKPFGSESQTYILTEVTRLPEVFDRLPVKRDTSKSALTRLLKATDDPVLIQHRGDIERIMTEADRIEAEAKAAAGKSKSVVIKVSPALVAAAEQDLRMALAALAGVTPERLIEETAQRRLEEPVSAEAYDN